MVMTKLMKRKKNRRLNPWSNKLFTPWNRGTFVPMRDSLFTTGFENIPNLMRFDDIFKDDFFESDSLMPAMNVTEHENCFEIEFAAPGFTKKDFDVTIEDDVLHVSGEKKKQSKEKEKDFTVKEFSYKSFRRSTRIPESVDLNQKIKPARRASCCRSPASSPAPW